MFSTKERTTARLLDVELEGDTMIVTPRGDLPEFAFEEIEEESKHAVKGLLQSSARNVIMDLHRMNFSGSAALGFFIRLWKVVIGRGGIMVFCNVSEDEREILSVTHLDRWWPFCPSLATAKDLIRLSGKGSTDTV